MSAWTDDRGNLSRRLASIRPAELHQALTGAAIEGIRHGLPAELLDGYEAARNGRSLGYQLDRARHDSSISTSRLASASGRPDARRNANLTDRRRPSQTIHGRLLRGATKGCQDAWRTR